MIIGAGIIGSSIAWRLAQAGARVRLVDAGTLGGEASSAGAGMLAPGGEFDRDSHWARMALQSLRMYPAFVHDLEAESGIRIDFGICGALDVACSADELANATDRARRQAELGIPSQATGTGIFYPDDGFVAPQDVLQALRRAIQSRGVDLRENCRITSVDGREAGAVVIAAGAWSGEIQASSSGRGLCLEDTFPVKGHLIGYRLEPGSLGAIRRRGHTYILQRSSGFTIAGSTEQRVGFDRGVDDAICRDIHERACRLWPPLRKEIPSERWVGFRPALEMMQPRIGQEPATNFWLAYGHFRNGILLTPVTAQRIADEITASLGKD